MSTRSRITIAEACSFVGWKSQRSGLSVCDANASWGVGKLENIIAKEI